MSSSAEPAVMEARYTWGGDEFLFVEVAESMSLAANFRVMSIAAKLSAMQVPGIVDVCPANASLLYSLAIVGLFWLIAWAMYRRNCIVRV